MSLLAYLGKPLMDALEPMMVHCPRHRLQPYVPACPCVIDGEAPAEATMGGVFCESHLRRFVEHDGTADADVVPWCLECARRQGITLGG